MTQQRFPIGSSDATPGAARRMDEALGLEPKLHDAKTSRAIGVTEGRESIAARFGRFHRDNPHVWDRLIELADDQLAHGATKLGIAQLFEVMRYEDSVRTSGDPYQLNNDYRATYARALMDEYLRFRGLFELRDRPTMRD